MKIMTCTVPALAAAVAFSLAPARALPLYAEQTGLPCGRCHVDPAGGGPRTAFGNTFAANGHRLPGERTRRRRDDERGYGPGMMGDDGMMGGHGHHMMDPDR
jgi:hypothetical protein